jgi:hypothetical protein
MQFALGGAENLCESIFEALLPVERHRGDFRNACRNGQGTEGVPKSADAIIRDRRTMHRSRFSIFPCIACGLLLAAQTVYGLEAATQPATQPSTQPGVPTSFIRFLDDGQGGGSLETADVAFINPQGVSVHLIAAIHIGEKSYYDSLNEDFRSYQVVLYELIKPRDMAPPAPGQTIQSDSTISQFQRFLKDTLELDFQLDDIDYSAPNFVNADLDRDTFEKMQAERGESFESLMIQQILNSFNQSTTRPDETDAQQMEDMIHVLTRPDMERQIKVVIARQLGEMDMSASGLDGPQGSVILTERNKAAIQTLQDTIATGKKNIAIFYGCAHMPDQAKRLEDLGFMPVSTQWRVAWDLAIRPDQPSAMEKVFDSLFKSLSGNDK